MYDIVQRLHEIQYNYNKNWIQLHFGLAVVCAPYLNGFISPFLPCSIKLWMHLESRKSTKKSLALWYRLWNNHYAFFMFFQLPVCIHNSMDSALEIKNHFWNTLFTYSMFKSIEFYLKIISKWPVSQHFKESVVINILANILQIIMLSTSTNTFLTVHSTLQFCKVTVWINCSEEDWFILTNKRKYVF